MGYPAKLLSADESIVYEMRPHWRSLVFPMFWLLILVAAWTYLFARSGGWFGDSSGTRAGFRWVITIAALVVLIGWVIRPFVYWFSTQYVLTDHRIIVRTGILARRGRDMPLSRVNDVSFSHTVFERFLNCGTIVVESAGTQGQLVIASVPNVETIQREIYRLHDEDDSRRRREAEDDRKPPELPGQPDSPPQS
jgi:uncharacterized membrane protein YdbT with pleckstrin-like domain